VVKDNGCDPGTAWIPNGTGTAFVISMSGRDGSSERIERQIDEFLERLKGG
jgi:hypothetical protein